MHLAQIAFAFSRFGFKGERFQVMPLLVKEVLHRLEDG